MEQRPISPGEMEVLSLVARKTINAVAITDVKNNILWINDAYSRITGYPAEEAIGNPPVYLSPAGGTDPETIYTISQKLGAGEEFECEVLHYNKSGAPCWMHVHVQPVYDDGGRLTRYFYIGTDITERKKLHETIERQKTEQHKEISRAIFHAEERERNEIGLELHDNVNQLLATVKLYLATMRKSGKYNIYDLECCTGFVDEAIHEIRMLTHRIMSPVSRRISLIDSLRQLLQPIAETGIIGIRLDIDGFEEEKTGHDCRQNLFRIVQEQLNNILKYADARQVTIRLTTDAAGITLTITDDGKGFEVHATPRGIGLINIHHRAESFHGRAEIFSAAGKGCTLQVSIPACAGAA